MRSYQIYVFILLIILIHTEDSCSRKDGFTVIPSQASDCNGRLSTSEKDKGYTHCCYVKYDKIEKILGQTSNSQGKLVDRTASCEHVRQKTFDNINKYIEISEIFYGYDKYEIDCYSQYIKLSLVSLILFFI